MISCGLMSWVGRLPWQQKHGRHRAIYAMISHSIPLVIFSLLSTLKEGGVRGVRKPQNRTEIRQKTANRIGLFPEYRNRAYM